MSAWIVFLSSGSVTAASCVTQILDERDVAAGDGRRRRALRALSGPTLGRMAAVIRSIAENRKSVL